MLFQYKTPAVPEFLDIVCGLFYELYYLCKNLRVGNGKVGKSLAIELYVLLVKHVDERGVVQIKLSNGSIETNVPKGSESTLLVAAVDVRVRTCLHHRILYAGEDVTIHSLVSFCLSNDILVSLV